MPGLRVIFELGGLFTHLTQNAPKVPIIQAYFLLKPRAAPCGFGTGRNITYFLKLSALIRHPNDLRCEFTQYIYKVGLCGDDGFDGFIGLR